MEKQLLIQGLVYEKYRMILEYLIISESKKTRGKKPPLMGIYQNDTKAGWKEYQWSKLQSSEQQNKVVLEYNTKYK